MTIPIEVLRALDPEATIPIKVRDLLAAFAVADAGSPAGERRRMTVRDVAAARGCSATTARSLFRLIPNACQPNGRDWECRPEDYEEFAAGLASGAIVLPTKARRASQGAARRDRPSLGAWRGEDAAPAPRASRRRAGGEG